MSKDRMPEEVAVGLPFVSEKCVNCGCMIHIDITRELAAERTRSAEKDEEIAKLRGELQSQAEVMEKMRESIKPFSDAYEFMERDRMRFSGRTGSYPLIEDYILEAHFKHAYETFSRLEKKDGNSAVSAPYTN